MNAGKSTKGDKLIKKIVCLIIATLVLLMNVSPALAQELPKEVIVKVWTDKPYYKPGEEGKLTIVVMNNGEEAGIFIENISITYPWWPTYIDGKWVGNDTIFPTKTEKGLEYGDIYQVERSFKIPRDGRAKSGTITVRVYFAGDRPPRTEFINLVVDTAPPSDIEGLDRIVSLLAVQIILTVVVALVLAAAIYLSAKRLRRVPREHPASPPPPPSPPESGET